MCFGGSPKVPDAPPPVQEAKQPDTAAYLDKAKKNKDSSVMGGGSLLTGPSGVASVSTGKTSLLGG